MGLQGRGWVIEVALTILEGRGCAIEVALTILAAILL